MHVLRSFQEQKNYAKQIKSIEIIAMNKLICIYRFD